MVVAKWSAVVLAIVVAIPADSRRQAPTPASVTRAQFQGIRWLEGRWRGSGGNVAQFFEEYRFLNDTTIEMKFIDDSAGTKVDSRGHIMLVRGRVTYVTRDTADATAFSATAVTFTPRKTGNPWTFTFSGDGAWTARVGPRGSTIYQMKRIAR